LECIGVLQHELLGDSIEDAEGQCNERRTLNAQEGRNIVQVGSFTLVYIAKAIIVMFI
jgi:hypothetical protein